MTSLVLDLLVPGAGSAVNALVMIFKLCESMKEGQKACSRVHRRLADIMTELEKMEKNERLPANDALERYAQTLRRCFEFLSRYKGKPLYSRLLQHQKMMGEVRALNEEIDALVQLLNIATTGAIMEWREQWEQDYIAQTAMLEKLIDNSESVLSEVRDTRAQVEAITVLKFESEQRHAQQSAEMLRLIRKLCGEIVRASTVAVPSVPQWFLPPDDLAFDPEPFARGSFGALHRGTWGSGARVVVKTLLLDQNGVTDAARTQFLNEIDIWYKMHHPNVIKMFGASHVTSPPFIVCEDATNGNMASYLASSNGNNKQHMWRLLYEAALGVEYLHKNRVVHGDLKLNNLLVGSDGAARVADFGLSFVRASSVLSDRPSSPVPSAGGLRWKAPECLQRRPTFASDVYALGMCCIEAATGEPPFSFVDDATVYCLIRDGKIPEQPEGMANDAWELVQRMTVTDPDQRPSLADVIAQLSVLMKIEKATRVDQIHIEVNETEMTRPPELVNSVAETPQSPHAGRPLHRLEDANEDEFEFDNMHEDTSTDDLLSTLRKGSVFKKERATLWLYRRADKEDTNGEIKKGGGYRLLVHSIRDESTSFIQQVYAFGALHRMSHLFGGIQPSELEDLRKFVRVPTKGDLQPLAEAIARVPDDEDNALEALEKVCCLAIARPENLVLLHSMAFIPKLVRVVRVSSSALLSGAIMALGCVADGVTANQVAIAEAGAIPLLLDVVTDGEDLEQRNSAARSLSVLTQSDEGMLALFKAGVTKPLVQVLMCDSTNTQQPNMSFVLDGIAARYAEIQAKEHPSAAETDLLRRIERDFQQETPMMPQLLKTLDDGADATKALAAFALAMISIDREQSKNLNFRVIDSLEKLVKCRETNVKANALLALAAIHNHGNDRVAWNMSMVQLVGAANEDGSRLVRNAASVLMATILRSVNADTVKDDLPLLLEVASSWIDKHKLWALKHLQKLDTNSCKARHTIASTGRCVQVLAKLIENKNIEIKLAAVTTLANTVGGDCSWLAYDCHDHRQKVIKGLSFQPVVMTLASDTSELASYAALLVARLCRKEATARTEFLACDPFPGLVAILRNGTANSKESAAFAAGALMKNNPSGRDKARAAGVIDALYAFKNATPGETAWEVRYALKHAGLDDGCCILS